MMTALQTINLGLGEMRAATEQDGVLACLGLGSCIALSLYDPISKTGAMAHMVLPSSFEGRGLDGGKFVDLAVPRLIESIQAIGGRRERLVTRMAGGAQMISSVHGDSLLNIGARNAEAAHEALRLAGLRPAKTDLGGNRGRTVRLYLDTGKVVVSIAGGDSYEL